jgi:CheY-like chemotaxis protein
VDESLGYVALSAANSGQALAFINGPQAIDLLFTDMIMPGALNRRQIADQAMRLRPSLKVLFTFGYTDDAVIHFGWLDPDVLLLAKPYRKADLARMIRSALTGARYKLCSRKQ